MKSIVMQWHQMIWSLMKESSKGTWLSVIRLQKNPNTEKLLQCGWWQCWSFAQGFQKEVCHTGFWKFLPEGQRVHLLNVKLFKKFSKQIRAIYDKCKDNNGGEIASYIPELTRKAWYTRHYFTFSQWLKFT